MTVGESVRKAIDDWDVGDLDAAMLHACNAIDGTASKVYPDIKGSNLRFTTLLRDNYDILGPMGAPGINLEDTRFPVKVERPKASEGRPDIADVIYGIHRVTHGHGQELPDGFALLRNASGPDRYTAMNVEKRGTVQLSDRMIFALLAVAVVSPSNADQRVPDGHFLKFEDEVLPINDWWGRLDDLRDLIAQRELPSVTLNFAEWMDGVS
jgi:hypothetical protein